ncbi:MAG: hypothetical protein WBE79_05210 [Candidatus Cybelea sp.]
MIVAAAAALALGGPSRDALIERWLRANRTHSPARLESGPPVRTVESADLRVLVERELAVPGRYRLASPPAAVSEPWWMRVWEWLSQRWQRLWNAIFARVHVGRAAAASIGDVLLVLLGLLLIFVVVRLLMNFHLARSTALLESTPLEGRPSPRALYKEACSAANRGDYGGAAVLLFAATVALLDRQGTVEAARSATVGDFRRALRRRNAALIPSFDAVAAPFVQRAYAERAVDELQWRRAREAFESLLPHASS